MRADPAGTMSRVLFLREGMNAHRTPTPGHFRKRCALPLTSARPRPGSAQRRGRGAEPPLIVKVHGR
eukprot:2918241-Prymnesium_polylepis.1